VLTQTLRKSDIIFQYSPDQFFVVLPLLIQKDTAGVIERVMKRWEKSGYHNRVKIEYASSIVSCGDDGMHRVLRK
jgi:GGDEF domain-containing protein